MMRKLTTAIAVAALCLVAVVAIAQTQGLPTFNGSTTISVGGTYQLLQAASNRRSLTIQNNNAVDICYIEVSGLVPVGATTGTPITLPSGTMTAVQVSITLLAGGSYSRFSPYTPAGPIVVTCANNGDTVYLDTQ